MPTINRPTPVDTPTSQNIIPLSQIDRAPAPVADSAPPPPVIPRSAIDRAPNPVNPTADPSVSGGGNVAPLPLVTEISVPVEVTGNENNVIINQPVYLTVDDEGSVVLDRTTILNFVGNGVVVTRSGATQATVTITHDGTGPSLGNWAFTANTMYNLNGGLINNSDLSHGGTAHLELPENGGAGALNLLNYYGDVTLTAGTNPGSTHTLTLASDGSLSLAGNIVAGNVAAENIFASGTLTANLVAGNISAPDGNGSVLFNNDGIIGAGTGFNYDLNANMLFAPGITAEGSQITGVDALYVGIGGYVVLGSSVIAQLTSNVDSYSQINQQNINTGPSASGDYIITADNGTDSTYYLDVGLAGSNHADPDFFGDTATNNDAYMYVTATDQAGPSSPAGPGNLIIGSTNGVIKLFVGNTAQANVIATVASDGISVTGNIVGVTANNNGYMQWVGNSSGDGIGFTTMQLVPDITLGSEQRIIVDPTGPNHIHLRAGGTQDDSAAQLYLGGENSHFKVDNGLNPNVYATANSYKWTFGSDGNFTLPGDNVSTAFSRITSLANSSGDGAGYTTLGLIPDINLTGSDQYLIIDPTAPGHVHIRAGGTQDDSSADLFLGGENSYFRIAAGANSDAQISANNYSWTFDSTGNLNLPGGYTIGEPGGPTLRVSAPSSTDAIQLNWANEVSLTLGNTGAANIAQIGTAGGYWNFDQNALLNLPGGNVAIGLQYGTEAILATNTDFGVATQGNGTTFLNWSDDVANTSVLSAIYVNAPGSVTGNIQVRTGVVGSPNNWTFVTTGNLELPSEGNIVGITPNNIGHLQWVGNSSGDGGGYTTMRLIPDNTVEAGDQYLIIDPTGGGHIHLRAGGTQDASNAILFIGGENSYVSIGSGSNPPVTIAANNYSWSFGTDSQFSAAGNIYTLGEVRSGSTVTPPVALANLTATAGSRAFVNDANLVAAGNFGQQVTGGAGNTVPVWSDGTNWYIG